MAVALADAEKIQAEMRQVRSELREDVKEVVASARELSDWRQYVRAAPWLSLGAAAAIGYFFVPPRTVVVRPNADDLLEVAKAHKLVVQTSQAPKRPTLMSQLIGMASGALVNGALALASQQVDQFLKQQRPAPRTGNHDPRGERHV
jgi:hypothetical protein